jgi:membrane protein DedA with SNARE-associated domain
VLFLGYESDLSILLLATICALFSLLGSLVLYHAGRYRGKWVLSKIGVSTTKYERIAELLQEGAWIFVFLAALGSMLLLHEFL